MKDLIEALTIFAKYAPDNHNPTHCEHDMMMVMGAERTAMTKEDLVRIEALGFYWSAEYDCWASFRFGSA